MTEQTHYPGEDLPAGEGSRVLWSFEPTGTLIIFVHGWRGSPAETWPQFHGLVFDDPTGGFGGCDVVFFGYPSVWRSAEVGADMIYRFLNSFLSSEGRLQARYLVQTSGEPRL